VFPGRDPEDEQNDLSCDATLTGATTLKLCRLRYVGSARQWQFRDPPAGTTTTTNRVFPTGLPHRHLPTSPQHHLRPVPQGPGRLGLTPDELTGQTTKLAI
jgi:hypothetical protein